MANHEPAQEQAISSVIGRQEPHEGIGSRIKLVFARAIFWTYERGSWQYDVICAVIVAFIFLTPRAWFKDRPTLQLSDLRHRQGVIEVGHVRGGSEYLIDSRLVDSLGSATTEEAVRTIMEARLQRSVTVKSMEPVRDKNNVMLGYTVVVAP